MTRLITDTSGLLAAMTPMHSLHSSIRSSLAEAEGRPIVSPLVLAELDYLLASRLGTRESLRAIDAFASGGYEIPSIDEDELLRARTVLAKYADLNLGLTDAINVVLADRYGTDSILTLDQRHFRAVRPLTNRYASFRVIPADN